MSRLLLQGVVLMITAGFPGLAFAQDGPDFKSVVGSVVNLLDMVVAVLVGIATLIFVYGAAEYVFQAGSEGDVEAGRNRMLAGVVGLFFIAVIWGVVRIVGATFGLV